MHVVNTWSNCGQEYCISKSSVSTRRLGQTSDDIVNMQSEGSSAAGPSSPRRPMSYEPAEGQETSSMITRWSSYFSGMLSSTPDNEKERLKMEKDWTKCEKWKTDLMKKSESMRDFILRNKHPRCGADKTAVARGLARATTLRCDQVPS